MRKVLEHILSEIVDHPEAIKLTEVNGEKTTIYELRCNKEDLGKVIGKSGKTVGAIRALLSALSSRKGRKAVLEIVE
ncbi:MAG: KH domain-containing protein [Verrucomicrobiota bacterium]|jgi:predicted RNA-binding protein YlqC (UPF0109 family)